MGEETYLGPSSVIDKVTSLASRVLDESIMAIESEVDDSGGESAWIRRSRGFGENVGAETTRDTTTRMVYKTICTRRKEKSIMIVRVETCSRETRSVSHSFCTCQASRIATIAKTPYSQWPLKYTGAAVFWLLNGGALLECSQRTIRESLCSEFES